MKILSILLLVGFASNFIYWAFTAGGPVYMKDLDGKLRRIPGAKPDWPTVLVVLVLLGCGIYKILTY